MGLPDVSQENEVGFDGAEVLALMERLTGAFTLREVYEGLLDMMTGPFFGATDALVLEGDPDNELFIAVATTRQDLQGAQWTRSERLSRVIDGQIVALKDVTDDSTWHARFEQGSQIPSAVILIPIRHSVVLVGLHNSPGYFNRDHVLTASKLVPSLSQIVYKLAMHQYKLQRLRSEQERMQMREQFLFINQAARALGVGVAVLDDRGELSVASEALSELVSGWASPQDWWRSVRSVLSQTPVTGAEAVGEGMNAYDRRQAKRTAEISSPRNERMVFELTFTGRAHELEDGSMGHVILAADVTRWALAEESLKIARDQAERANMAKSNFLANMSHELRTPLNAIIGYAEMLVEDSRSTKEDLFSEDLLKIHASAHQLLRLINDVLDLSKIEAGKLERNLSNFLLLPLIEEVELTIHPMIMAGNNRFVCYQESVPDELFSDRDRLRQVLLNILSNAAKFTEAGHISLRVRGERRAGEAWVVFEITDTGIGIPEEKLERLFAAFEQIDSSNTREYGGTGLGLAISERFCQLLGGFIEVESTLGVGSTFKVILPIKAPLI
jgi:signal transduction histidine kinase